MNKKWSLITLCFIIMASTAMADDAPLWLKHSFRLDRDIPADFWNGFWHGSTLPPILPFLAILSVIDPKIENFFLTDFVSRRISAVQSGTFMYNFGFFYGLAVFFTILAISMKELVEIEKEKAKGQVPTEP